LTNDALLMQKNMTSREPLRNRLQHVSTSNMLYASIRAKRFHRVPVFFFAETIRSFVLQFY